LKIKIQFIFTLLATAQMWDAQLLLKRYQRQPAIVLCKRLPQKDESFVYVLCCELSQLQNAINFVTTNRNI
jgi:hypothetical protein